MLFNTPQYLLFLPIVVVIYYILPQKVRYIWLLLVSYYFYMQWNPRYILLLLGCTVITYICGIILEKCKNATTEQKDRRSKLCLVLCILVELGLLGFFKYFNFVKDGLNYALSHIGTGQIAWEYDILLPVGISFFILQTLGYVIDVYRDDIQAEKNFLRYALFVAFFPQLVAGPIERSRNLLKQLREHDKLRYENIQKGMIYILYGLFLKMIIADRAAMIVDTVYGNSQAYPGFYVVVATMFFAIQIYCDFHGYTTIARGSALLMGIKLMSNFEAPYFARTVKEFWGRWHISLSTWFRDYLYIPLGGNRRGRIRKERNLLIVFAVSGLWHGASGAYVFWGLLNGIYQVLSDLVKKIKLKDSFSIRLFQRLLTFGLITFAWLFFRAGSGEKAMEMLRAMLSDNNWTILFDGSLYNLGVARNYMNVLLLSILGLFCVDYQKYKGKDVYELFMNQCWVFRTFVIVFLIFLVLLYGCYGNIYDTQQFIYFQF